MIARIAVLLFALSASGAEAHDYWSDGKPVPGLGESLVLRTRRTPIIFAPTRSIGSPTTITRSTATSVAYPSGRRCRARTEIIGSSTGTTAAAASPGSTASSCRWTSDFRRPFALTLIRRRPPFGAGTTSPASALIDAGARAAVGSDKAFPSEVGCAGRVTRRASCAYMLSLRPGQRVRGRAARAPRPAVVRRRRLADRARLMGEERRCRR